ncbi:MAG: TlpA family protein disulfide reductase [Gemmatimonadetes bacterium]|nr:TlpA family protein disulfide reductase [Gemmatimonadota bacterium]
MKRPYAGGAPVLALALPLVVGACRDDRGPVSAPNPAAIPPSVVDDLTTYPAASETLFVRMLPEPSPDDLTLVFYRGRGVDRDASGQAFVPDPQDSRVLVVGADLRVEDVIGGPTEAGGGLGQPLAAAPAGGGGLFVADAEHDAGLLYYDADGAYAGAAVPPVSNPDFQTAADGAVWAARSPYLLRFEETPLDAPLLYRFDPLEGTGVGIANIEPVAAPAWNRVSNAGPIAVGPDGTAFFAFFLRNELRAYRGDGDLVWRSARAVGFETHEPAFSGSGAELRYSVRPVTQALSMGPDGLLYSLTASDSMPTPGAVASGRGHRRIEIWDPATGELLRAATVPAASNTFAVDPDGRVYAIDPMRIDRTAPPPERAPLPDVPLISFDGDTTRFIDHRGKALLVNFWASWCLPCREEIPQLKRYYATLDPTRVEFLAISVDEDRQAGLDFIEPYELPFPVFHNGPEMQSEFHYIGLPFTLIVDTRGRIVEEIRGFGSVETWNYLTEKLETEIPPPSATPAEAGAGHEGHGMATDTEVRAGPREPRRALIGFRRSRWEPDADPGCSASSRRAPPGSPHPVGEQLQEAG